MRKFTIGSCIIRNGGYESVLDDVKDVQAFVTSPPYNIGSKSSKKITNRKLGGYDGKSWGGIRDYQDSMRNPEEFKAV